MTPTTRRVTALLVAAVLRPAQAVDLLPTDVIAPPPGITTVQLSYLSSRRGDLYRDGVRQPLATRVTVDQLLQLANRVQLHPGRTPHPGPELFLQSGRGLTHRRRALGQRAAGAALYRFGRDQTAVRKADPAIRGTSRPTTVCLKTSASPCAYSPSSGED